MGITYKEAVDSEMLKLFGIDTSAAGIEEERLEKAQANGQTPKEFVIWFGEKYDLERLEDW